MITIKQEYPYRESNGTKNPRLIKFYAEDERGFRYRIENKDTHKILDEAICLYPSLFTYIATTTKCVNQPKIKKNFGDGKRNFKTEKESVSDEKELTKSEEKIIDNIEEIKELENGK